MVQQFPWHQFSRQFMGLLPSAFDALVTQCGVGVIVVDHAGCVLYANAPATEQLRVSVAPGDRVADALWDVVGVDPGASSETVVYRFIGGRSVRLMVRVLPLHGTEGGALVCIQPLM